MLEEVTKWLELSKEKKNKVDQRKGDASKKTKNEPFELERAVFAAFEGEILIVGAEREEENIVGY